MTPRTLYGLNSNRSRYQIIYDYAASHDLSAKQVDELVRQLPDYGVKSMLAASAAVLARPCEVIDLAEHRLRNNKTPCGAWAGPGSAA